jgi:nitroreductase
MEQYNLRGQPYGLVFIYSRYNICLEIFMDTLTAIHTRQSVGKVKPDPVHRELIEKLLSAAVQAPNHYKVYPWRFVVMTGPGRERLGDVMAQSFKKAYPFVDEDVLNKERAKPLRAPVLIAVGVDKPSEPKVSEVENICAAAAAVENLLLAAHELGLGAQWRTGPAALDPAIKEFLGFSADQHLISFVYIGYPEFELPPKERPSFEDKTIWFD